MKIVQINTTCERGSTGKICVGISKVLRDKNIENMLSSLNLLTNDIRLTSFNHPRCRTYDEYFLYVDDYSYEDNYQKAIQNLLEEYPNDIILITGSLAFAFLIKDEFDKGVYTFKDEELPNKD